MKLIFNKNFKNILSELGKGQTTEYEAIKTQLVQEIRLLDKNADVKRIKGGIEIKYATKPISKDDVNQLLERILVTHQHLESSALLLDLTGDFFE